MTALSERSKEIIACISPGDCLGSKTKAAVIQQPIGTETMLGTILGQARGLSYRNNPQDESKPSIALTGPFKFLPVDADRPELRSMRCYLPSTVHDTIVSTLEGDNKRPIEGNPQRGKSVDVNLEPGAFVPIVLELGVRRVEGAVGYEYITQTSKKVPLALADPLAELQAAAGLAPALAAPAEQKQIAAPAATATEKPAETAKGRKR